MTNAAPLSMLQIGLIASPSQTSGSDRYYFELLVHLQALGDRVRGVVLGDPSAVEHGTVDVKSFAPEGSRALRRWSGLRQVVPRLISDSRVIVSHFAAHTFPVLDKLGRRPLIVHFHNPWLLEGRAAGASRATLALRWLQERAVYDRAAMFVVLSESNASVLESSYGISRSRIRVVPGGTDLTRFTPAGTRAEARARLGWPTDRPTVTIVARLVRAKGVDRAIEAMREIRRQVGDVQLAIVGAGPEEAALRELVHALELDQAVHFAGFQREAVADAYRAADLVLVPSIAFESFGLVAVEALACGTPVLVTPLLGLPEVVRPLDTCLILDGMQPEHIASKVSDALTGRLTLPEPSACVEYARRFDWQSVSAVIHNIYAEVA
jgi:glycosyltransferase involved in cell wall biosynthesis